MIADHAVVVFSPCRPDGQEARLLMMDNHRADNGVDYLRCDELQQRECSPVDIPVGEGREVGLVLRATYLVVHSAVPSVYVCDVGRLQEQVIHTVVEYSLASFVGLNLYLVKVTAPLVRCLLADSLEVPVRKFLLQGSFPHLSFRWSREPLSPSTADALISV